MHRGFSSTRSQITFQPSALSVLSVVKENQPQSTQSPKRYSKRFFQYLKSNRHPILRVLRALRGKRKSTTEYSEPKEVFKEVFPVPEVKSPSNPLRSPCFPW